MDEMTIDEKMAVIKAANTLRENYELLEGMLTDVEAGGNVRVLEFDPRGPHRMELSVPGRIQEGLTAAIIGFLQNKMDEQVEALKSFRIELVRGEGDEL